MKIVKRHVVAVLATLGAILALFAFAPGASAYPGDTGGVSVGTTNPTAGGTLPISGTNCQPNSTVTITLESTPIQLGTASTDSNGNYSTTVTLPEGTTGNHTIVITGAKCAATAGVSIQAPSGGGGLAGTGVAVVGLGALGVVLLIGGGLMLLAGRRRRVAA